MSFKTRPAHQDDCAGVSRLKSGLKCVSERLLLLSRSFKSFSKLYELQHINPLGCS